MLILFGTPGTVTGNYALLCHLVSLPGWPSGGGEDY